MARGRKRKKKPVVRRGIDPADVLAGRVMPTAEQLLELIARINPTGRELAPEVMAERYATKSALQSLLIDRFADELTVTPDPDSQAVILIRHRYVGRDACHAVLDELAPDARSWARLQLDLELDPGPAGLYEPDRARKPPRTRGAGDDDPPAAMDRPDQELSVEELRLQGQAAIAEFDFERAKELLAAAHSAARSDPGPAEDFLRLLVDSLGLFDEALAAGDCLPAQVAAYEPIRALLARSAAGLGQLERAGDLAAGLTGDRAAEVFLACADAALAAGDLAAARDHLQAAERAEGPPADLLERHKRLDALLADRHGIQEAQIERLVAEGDLDRAGLEAEALLSKWPDSKVARRARRARNKARREQQRREALDQGMALLEADDLPAGIESLKEALSLGADPDQVEPLIARAQTDLAARQEAAAVARVIELLAGSDPGSGLSAYLVQADRVRDQVRKAASSKLLGWLDQVVQPPASPKLCQQAVSAVLALEEVCALADQGDLSAAGRLIRQHDKWLARIAEARAVLARERELTEQQHREEARQAFEELGQALDEGDLDAATRAAKALDRSALDEADRHKAGAQLLRLAQAEELTSLESRLEARLERGDLLGARNLARRLAGQGGARQRKRWEVKAAEINQALRAHCKLRVMELPKDRGERLVDSLMTFLHDDELICLDPDGRSAWSVDSLAGWLFVRKVDLEDSTVVRAVALRGTEPLDHFVDLTLHQGRLWIADGAGLLLILDESTWDVAEFHELAELIPASERIERIQPVLSDRFVWLTSSAGIGREVARVIDLRASRIHRRLTDRIWTKDTLPGARPMVSCEDEGDLVVLAPDGGLVDHGRIPNERTLEACAVHPDGQRLVMVVAAQGFLPAEGIDLDLVVCELGGKVTRVGGLVETNEDYHQELATSTAQGLVFLVYERDDGMYVLEAFEPEGAGLKRIYHAESLSRLRLLRDADANHVAVMYRGLDGLLFESLGRKDPVFKGLDPAEVRLPAVTWEFSGCAWVEETYDEQVSSVASRYRNLRPNAQRAWLEDRIAKCEDDPHELVKLVRMVEWFDRQAATAAAAVALASHPDDPLIRLCAAHLRAEKSDHEEVEVLLGPVDLEALEESARYHCLHLHGLARLVAGDAAGARALWNKAQAEMKPKCDLATLQLLAAPLPEPLTEEALEQDCQLVMEIRARVRLSDEAFGRGDFEGARRVVDRISIYRADELQSLARLARAALAFPGETEHERYSTSFALATFLERIDLDSKISRSLTTFPYPEGRWGPEVIGDLAAQAKQWLDVWGDEAVANR